MSVPNIYAKKMKEKFDYDAVWEPNRKVKVGDYGVLERSGWSQPPLFDRIGNIRDHFKVNFTTRTGPRTATERLLSDGIDMGEVHATTGTQALGGEVSMNVTFTQGNSFIYHGSGMNVVEIEDKLQVWNDLLRHERWQPDYVLVTAGYETEGATVLLCNKENASCTLKGSASLTAGNLADPSVGLTVASTSSDIADYIIPEACIPLIRVVQLSKKKHPHFRKRSEQQRTGRPDSPPDNEGDAEDTDGLRDTHEEDNRASSNDRGSTDNQESQGRDDQGVYSSWWNSTYWRKERLVDMPAGCVYRVHFPSGIIVEKSQTKEKSTRKAFPQSKQIEADSASRIVVQNIDKQRGSIKIVVQNIDEQRGLASQLIQELDPDILLVQDINLHSEEEDFLNNHIAEEESKILGGGNAIIYTKEPSSLTDIQRITSPHPEFGGFVNSKTIVATVSVPKISKIRVVSFHGNNGQPMMSNKSISKLCNHVQAVLEQSELMGDYEDYPAIFAGEFNTWTMKHMEAVTTLMQQAGFEHAFSWPNKGREFPLDHVFLRNLQLTSAKIYKNQSDHEGAILELEIKE